MELSSEYSRNKWGFIARSRLWKSGDGKSLREDIKGSGILGKLT